MNINRKIWSVSKDDNEETCLKLGRQARIKAIDPKIISGLIRRYEFASQTNVRSKFYIAVVSLKFVHVRLTTRRIPLGKIVLAASFKKGLSKQILQHIMDCKLVLLICKGWSFNFSNLSSLLCFVRYNNVIY